MTTYTLNDFKNTAFKAIEIANQITLEYFRKNITIDNKQSHDLWDPVTIADKKTEYAIREIIEADFPTHGIIGEEYDDKPAQSEYSWIIDPIDGTKAFITGLPMWGTLIGVLKNNKPIFGLMAQPFVGDIFYGDGQSAFLRQNNTEHKLTTNNITNISDSIMFCTTPDMFHDVTELAMFNILKSYCKNIRYGTDCYGYAALAAGWGSLVYEANVKNYDIYPMIPIITGAGGCVSAPDGSDFKSGQVIASSNQILHNKILKLINS